VNAFGAEARKQLENISNATERIAALETEEDKLLQLLSKQADCTFRKAQIRRAKNWGHAIEVELDDLKMAAARFGVDFQTRPDPNGIPLLDGMRVAFDQNGFDRVEFLVAPIPVRDSSRWSRLPPVARPRA